MVFWCDSCARSALDDLYIERVTIIGYPFVEVSAAFFLYFVDGSKETLQQVMLSMNLKCLMPCMCACVSGCCVLSFSYNHYCSTTRRILGGEGGMENLR